MAGDLMKLHVFVKIKLALPSKKHLEGGRESTVQIFGKELWEDSKCRTVALCVCVLGGEKHIHKRTY